MHPDTANHISETEASMKVYRLPRSPSGIWVLIGHQKSHIWALFAEMWTVYCCSVLLICFWPIFWGADEDKPLQNNISATKRVKRELSLHEFIDCHYCSGFKEQNYRCLNSSGELIIDYCWLPMTLLDLGPLRGIFVPLTQLTRPIAS